MGKGDKKTKRGKIILGSHGVTRSRKSGKKVSSKPALVNEAHPEEKPKKAKPAKKAKEE